MFDNKNHFKQCTESCLNPCIFESVSKCKFRVKLVEFVKVLHFSGGAAAVYTGCPWIATAKKANGRRRISLAVVLKKRARDVYRKRLSHQNTQFMISTQLSAASYSFKHPFVDASLNKRPSSTVAQQVSTDTKFLAPCFHLKKTQRRSEVLRGLLFEIPTCGLIVNDQTNPGKQRATNSKGKSDGYTIWGQGVYWPADLFFFRLDISVICPVILLKLAVTVFTSPYFRILWPSWLNFFRSFEKKFGLWLKNNRKN